MGYKLNKNELARFTELSEKLVEKRTQAEKDELAALTLKKNS